jgi:hypothetical protein
MKKKIMKKAQNGANTKKTVSEKTVSEKTMVSPKVSPKKKPTVSPKKRTYDIIPDEVTNEGYLNLGPLEETPGGGFSRNGSMMKKTKMKMGGAMKKDEDNSSFAKLAPPYNKATYADKITGATQGKAKNGTKMKMGGKMAKQAAVAIAMKKAGKAPKKKMQYGGEAASMKPKGMKKAMMGTAMTNAPMMKKGGSMKKCKYGCK